MSFYVANGLGESIREPSPAQMKAFLDAIDASDEEHGAAWLSSSDDDYTLEWNGDGRLALTAPGQGTRHLKEMSRARTCELWEALAARNLVQVEAHAWQPGTGYVRTAERDAEIRQWQLDQDREFYDLLGAERSDTPCRREGCKRGAVALSALCRVHHFESINQRRCPFGD